MGRLNCGSVWVVGTWLMNSTTVCQREEAHMPAKIPMTSGTAIVRSRRIGSRA